MQQRGLLVSASAFWEARIHTDHLSLGLAAKVASADMVRSPYSALAKSLPHFFQASAKPLIRPNLLR